MTQQHLTCLNSQRGLLLRQKEKDVPDFDVNGLEAVEVGLHGRQLRVYFFRKVPENLVPANFVIAGGSRIPELHVTHLRYCSADNPNLEDCVDLELEQPGDLSVYTLKVVEVERGFPSKKALRALDPPHASVSFSFSVACPNDLDCLAPVSCQEEEWPEPDINYVAKDYASFRQLLLDRLALLIPDWKDRHVPDLGLTLVELLAYVGDYLSYYQDAVGTEAYLHTARQRISVRRHVRLIDYRMHEGCNARAFVHLATNSNLSIDPADICFVTNLFPSHSQGQAVVSAEILLAQEQTDFEIFEPMGMNSIHLISDHNEIHFYTWGDRECCLVNGATSATLMDEWVQGDSTQEQRVTSAEPRETSPEKQKTCPPPKDPGPDPKRKLRLQPGDFLLFEEVKGPRTGHRADADRTHRHVVRLTHVEPAVDPLIPVEAGKFANRPTPVLQIKWSVEDALLFSLCISTLGTPPACEYVEKVSVARGNLVPVDHGMSLKIPEDLGVTPAGAVTSVCVCECESTEPEWKPGKFSPRLLHGPVTFRSPDPGPSTSASAWRRSNPRQAVPCLAVFSIPPVLKLDEWHPLFTLQNLRDLGAGDPEQAFGRKLRQAQESGDTTLLRHLSPHTHRLLAGTSLPHLNNDLQVALLEDLQNLLQVWEPQLDLFRSQPNDPHMVVEIDDDHFAHLRFGDGRLGKAPPPRSSFFASYRVGNGSEGNVGPDAIRHVVFRKGVRSGAIYEVRNPLPATGGTDPESIEEVKALAPATIRLGQERAVNPDDYARLAEQHPGVQRAVAQLRWMGYREIVEVAVDPLGAMKPDAEFLREIARRLDIVRRIGHEVEVIGARYVPLDLQLVVYVKPDYVRSHVRKAIFEQLSAGFRPGGQRGFFHPDNFSFGDSLFHSQLVAEVQGVMGVETVIVERFQRLFERSHGELDQGVLRMSSFEVLQLANDPSHPEYGKLDLVMKGGK